MMDDPKERNQDEVANESTGIQQPVADTRETIGAAEPMNGEQVEDLSAEKETVKEEVDQ